MQSYLPSSAHMWNNDHYISKLQCLRLDCLPLEMQVVQHAERKSFKLFQANILFTEWQASLSFCWSCHNTIYKEESKLTLLLEDLHKPAPCDCFLCCQPFLYKVLHPRHKKKYMEQLGEKFSEKALYRDGREERQEVHPGSVPLIPWSLWREVG